MATTFLPYLTGEVEEGPRKEIFYFTDDGDLSALRYGDWKAGLHGADGVQRAL